MLQGALNPGELQRAVRGIRNISKLRLFEIPNIRAIPQVKFWHQPIENLKQEKQLHQLGGNYSESINKLKLCWDWCIYLPDGARKTLITINDAFLPLGKFLALAVFACLVIMFLVVCMPLGHHCLFRRKTSAFISFSHAQETHAIRLQQAMLAQGISPIRVPYSENSTHQQIITAVSAGLKKADVMICLPGRQESFVDSEVMTASELGKPIIFILSNLGGTLPNTADKRYPCVILERAIDDDFKAVSAFASYLGDDLASQVNIISASLASPFTRKLRRSFPLIQSYLLVSLFCICLWLAKYDHGQDGLWNYFPQKLSIVLSYALISSLVLGPSVYLLAFSLLFLIKYTRQKRTARRAREMARSGEFMRSDWLKVMKDVWRGNDLFLSLFENAPLAHHET
ncbi:MAG: hypothetical protein RLZZ609_2318 [Cyanobacteriota bacterium]|jgi:hypothetical protein